MPSTTIRKVTAEVEEVEGAGAINQMEEAHIEAEERVDPKERDKNLKEMMKMTSMKKRNLSLRDKTRRKTYKLITPTILICEKTQRLGEQTNHILIHGLLQITIFLKSYV